MPFQKTAAEAMGKLAQLKALASELRLAGVGEEDILAAVQIPTELLKEVLPLQS